MNARRSRGILLLSLLLVPGPAVAADPCPPPESVRAALLVEAYRPNGETPALPSDRRCPATRLLGSYRDLIWLGEPSRSRVFRSVRAVRRVKRGRPRREDLLAALRRLQAVGKPFDVFLLGDGAPGRFLLEDGALRPRDLLGLLGEDPGPCGEFPIRVAYHQAGHGADFLEAWRRLGAAAAVGPEASHREPGMICAFAGRWNRSLDGLEPAVRRLNWKRAPETSPLVFRLREELPPPIPPPTPTPLSVEATEPTTPAGSEPAPSTTSTTSTPSTTPETSGAAEPGGSGSTSGGARLARVEEGGRSGWTRVGGVQADSSTGADSDAETAAAGDGEQGDGAAASSTGGGLPFSGDSDQDGEEETDDESRTPCFDEDGRPPGSHGRALLVLQFYGKRSPMRLLMNRKNRCPPDPLTRGYDRAEVLGQPRSSGPLALEKVGGKDHRAMPSRYDFFRRLKALLRDGYRVDLVIFADGDEQAIRVADGRITLDDIWEKLGPHASDCGKLPLGLVYQMAAGASAWAPYWRELGARGVAFPRGVPMLPERACYFVRRWGEGGVTVDGVHAWIDKHPILLHPPRSFFEFVEANRRQSDPVVMLPGAAKGATAHLDERCVSDPPAGHDPRYEECIGDYYTKVWVPEQYWNVGAGWWENLLEVSRMDYSGGGVRK